MMGRFPDSWSIVLEPKITQAVDRQWIPRSNEHSFFSRRHLKNMVYQEAPTRNARMLAETILSNLLTIRNMEQTIQRYIHINGELFTFTSVAM